MKIFFSLSMAFLFAALSVNAGTFIPPKGCTAFLTVQMKSCRVEHHWTCEGDAEGTQWIMMLGNQGPTFLQQVDREFRWLQSFPQRSDISRALIVPEKDPNSLTELLATRNDDFDFQQTVFSGGVAVAVDHVTGFDRLNGTRVTIDGEPLLVTEFKTEISSSAGGETIYSTGNQYVSERFRSFFQGRETEIVGSQSRDFDDSPILFIEPGEAGFLADQPEFGCDEMMSRLDMPLADNTEKSDDL